MLTGSDAQVLLTLANAVLLIVSYVAIQEYDQTSAQHPQIGVSGALKAVSAAYSQLNTHEDHPQPTVEDNAERNVDESINLDIPLRRHSVTFSNVVIVKVIGSESLAFGPLKTSRNDKPVEGIISNDSINVYVPSPASRYLRFANGSSDMDSAHFQTYSLSEIFYLMRHREIVLTILLYGLNGFIQVAVIEAFPLWVSSCSQMN